jgi:hypothetical protein
MKAIAVVAGISKEMGLENYFITDKSIKSSHF